MSRTSRSARRESGLDGLDIDPVTGGLLSIAELQAAMRRIPATAAVVPQGPMPVPVPPVPVPPAPVPVLSGVGRGAASEPRPWHPAPAPVTAARPVTAAGPQGWLSGGLAALGFGSGLICVIGAHPGAGCSTVAVAVADAAGADPTTDLSAVLSADLAARGAGGSVARARVHLVECAPVTASGLAGVTSAELGIGPGGGWRHGRRGPVLVSRAAAGTPESAPQPPDLRAPVVVVDLGDLPARDVGAQLPADAGVVVVCQANLPGLRRIEGVLAHLDRVQGGDRIVVAVVGPARWPGPVRACVGPGLRSRDRAGQVVRVPLDRGLAVTGPTATALPRKVAAAGTRLWTAVRPAVQSLPSSPPSSPSSTSSAVGVPDAGIDFFDQRWEQQ